MAQILIIDDSPMTRRLAIKILEPDGHDILEAGSGNEGEEIAVTKTPDCILLDLLMPGKDGREVLKMLKEKGVASPVIVLTSDIQETTREECMKLGAFRFLNKPANENEMRRAVKEAITSTKRIVKMKITDKQLDILTELVNIGVGRGASVLNTMIRSHIKLDVPFLKVLEFSEFKMEMKAFDSDKFAVVELAFEGAFSGVSELIFPKESAAKLVEIIASEDSKGLDLDSIRAGTLSEIGNIVLNGVMGSISNMLQSQFRYSVPDYKEGTVDELFRSFDSGFDSTILMARTRFTVEELKIEGDLVLFFEMNAFSAFLAAIDAFSVDSLE